MGAPHVPFLPVVPRFCGNVQAWCEFLMSPPPPGAKILGQRGMKVGMGLGTGLGTGLRGTRAVPTQHRVPRGHEGRIRAGFHPGINAASPTGWQIGGGSALPPASVSPFGIKAVAGGLQHLVPQKKTGKTGGRRAPPERNGGWEGVGTTPFFCSSPPRATPCTLRGRRKCCWRAGSTRPSCGGTFARPGAPPSMACTSWRRAPCAPPS